jgi:hypothetical protein
MSGTQAQLVTFDEEPTQGGFFLGYEEFLSAPIRVGDTASDVQTAVRTIPGLGSVVVTGDFDAGFLIEFIGVESPSLFSATKEDLDEEEETMPINADISIMVTDGTRWTQEIRRGDRIIDSIHGTMTIDEIIEIPDIGGAVMGYRVRCE